MAQYKVPQDVEADDKLIGPFSFRQFIYLLVAAGLVALCFPLFKIFPLLIILPAPFILFLLALSLPLKKDQPMETYISAVLSYYMKPHNRLWEPGEPESTIIITAPKKTDEIHLKELDQDEAMHRLSFLADIVDTEGYAIKGMSSNGVREDVIAEASTTKDIFEAPNTAFSQQTFQQTSNTRHAELVNQMRDAIANNSQSHNASIVTHNDQPQPQYPQPAPQQPQQLEDSLPTLDNPNVIKPDLPIPEQIVEQQASPTIPSQDIIELANNPDFSIETIAQQAKRINEKQNNEVYISLH